MDQNRYFPDERRYSPGSWCKLAAAAAQVRLQHRIASVALADATGIASALGSTTCESCASIELYGIPRLIPSAATNLQATIPDSAADPRHQDPTAPRGIPSTDVNDTCIWCTTKTTSMAFDIEDADGSGEANERQRAMLPICSHCAFEDIRERAKLKSVVEHAISEMHWCAGKIQELCGDRLHNSDLIEGNYDNTMLDKFEALARMLQRLHLYCQDAADAPADIALPELKTILRQVPGNVCMDPSRQP